MNQKRFHDLLLNTQGFYVPFVVDDLSSKRVLTTELVHGECMLLFTVLHKLCNLLIWARNFMIAWEMFKVVALYMWY